MSEPGQGWKTAALKISKCVCLFYWFGGDCLDYMKEAILEAEKSYTIGEVPVGCIIVKNDKIIARAHNKKETTKVATRHAEIIAIEKACKKMKNWRLDDCIMYVTLEPCLMCAGAILQCRIKQIVYAVENEKFGCIKSLEKILENPNNNHYVIIEKGNYAVDSKKLLQKFFRDKRKG